MDARPVRARGIENIVPSLHQRHKSTGSLGGMISNSISGFRGPAKRSAFGDVTNLAKNVGLSRDTGKDVKVHAPVDVGHAQSSAVNKEAASRGKDNESKPAQRTIALTTKPRASNENEMTGLSKPITQAAGLRRFVENFDSAESGSGTSYVAAGVDYIQNVEALPQPQDVLPLQPRHHKSQPQLKKQQPALRKTQSKQLERSVSVLHEYDSQDAVVDFDSAPSQLPFTTSTVHASSHPSPTEESALDVTHDEYYIDLHAKLPGISEEPDHAPIPTKNVSIAGLSEPEEYWDDEDDDYDDHDQAYTTAHSFRTRDMTGGVTTMIAPRVTTRVQRELDEAQLEVEQTRFEDIEEEMWDVSMVTEYGEEIFEYMRELEIKMLPNPHYMEAQTEIQWSMRSVLMDWLVQVHNRFNLLPETLFLTVNYIDRFLTSKVVSIGKLQLVGATAILVASKYEEINCPSLEEIVYMVDGGYTTEEILKAERFMLSMLSFELGWPGPMSFLRRVSKADDYDLETRTLAKYFLELTIMDERFVATPPSFLAAGAHCLSRLVLEKGEWTKPHVHYSGYTWSQLKPLVTMLLECCECPRQHHSAVFEKYRERRFKEASTIVQEALDAGFQLPRSSTVSQPLQPLQPLSNSEPGQIQYLNGLLVSA